MTEPPFTNSLLDPAQNGIELAIIGRCDLGTTQRVNGEPDEGTRTLVLCPKNKAGEDVRPRILEQIPDDWELFDSEGKPFADLPTALSGVARVVGIVLGYPSASDVRDGQENAAAGAVGSRLPRA